MRHLRLTLLLLPLLALPVRAGSITADSINDRSAARQAAMSQIPRGATITRTRCEDIQVGGFGLPRYRCTVWYNVQPPAPAPDGSESPGAPPDGSQVPAP